MAQSWVYIFSLPPVQESVFNPNRIHTESYRFFYTQDSQKYLYTRSGNKTNNHNNNRPGFTCGELARFSLVSKQWNALLRPYLYANYQNLDKNNSNNNSNSNSNTNNNSRQFSSIQKLFFQQVWITNAIWIRSLSTESFSLTKKLAETGQCTQLNSLTIQTTSSSSATSTSHAVALILQNHRLKTVILKSSSFRHDYSSFQVLSHSKATKNCLTRIELSGLTLLNTEMNLLLNRVAERIEIIKVIGCRYSKGLLSKNWLSIKFKKLQELVWQSNIADVGYGTETTTSSNLPFLLPWLNLLLSTSSVSVSTSGSSDGGLKKLTLGCDTILPGSVLLWLKSKAMRTVKDLTLRNLLDTDWDLYRVLTLLTPQGSIEADKNDDDDDNGGGGNRDGTEKAKARAGGLESLEVVGCTQSQDLTMSIQVLCQSPHQTTLTNLTFSYVSLSTENFEAIMGSCTGLKCFQIKHNMKQIRVRQPQQQPYQQEQQGQQEDLMLSVRDHWVCTDLEEFFIDFDVSNPETIDTTTNTTKLRLEQVLHNCGVIWQQISKLKRLRFLTISLVDGYEYVHYLQNWEKAVEHWMLLGDLKEIEWLTLNGPFPYRIIDRIDRLCRSWWPEAGICLTGGEEF